MDTSVQLPVTAIIQPLTSTAATMTFIESNVTTLVEKLLVFPSAKTQEDKKLTKFTLSCVDHSLPHLEPLAASESEQFLSSKQHKQPSSSIPCLKNCQQAFNPASLETWFSVGGKCGNYDNLVRQLGER